ncbi:TPA_asm: hypothetical protein GYP43_03090 [Listeria monocytogenes]|nr:hypothetical protein [Listeria monocytogenes]
MIIFELVNPKTEEKAVFEREDTTLEELEAYYKLQDDMRQKAIELVLTNQLALDMQLEYIVKLFGNKNLTVKRLKKEVLSKNLKSTIEGIFKQISPEDFDDDDDDENGNSGK